MGRADGAAPGLPVGRGRAPRWPGVRRGRAQRRAGGAGQPLGRVPQSLGGARAAQARTLAALPTHWKTLGLPARRRQDTTPRKALAALALPRGPRTDIARPGRRWHPPWIAGHALVVVAVVVFVLLPDLQRREGVADRDLRAVAGERQPREPLREEGHRLGEELQPGLAVLGPGVDLEPDGDPLTAVLVCQALHVLDDHHVVAGAVGVPDAHEHRHQRVARRAAHDQLVDGPGERPDLEERVVLLLEQLLDPQPGIVAVERPDALVLDLGHHPLAVLRGELLRLDAERAAEGDQHRRHHAGPGVAAVDVARVVRQVDRNAADRGADDVELRGVRRRELARPLPGDRAAGVADQADLLATGHAEVALGGADAVEGVPAGLVAGHPVQAGTLEVGHGHGVPLGREREHQPGLGVCQSGVRRSRVAALQRVARRALVAQGVVEAEVTDQSEVERPGRVDHGGHGRRRTALLVLGPVEQLAGRHHPLPAPGNADADGAGPEHRPRATPWRAALS